MFLSSRPRSCAAAKGGAPGNGNAPRLEPTGAEARHARLHPCGCPRLRSGARRDGGRLRLQPPLRVELRRVPMEPRGKERRTRRTGTGTAVSNIIKIVGIDPSMRNLGLALGHYDLDTRKVDLVRVKLVQTESNRGTKKVVRQSS